MILLTKINKAPIAVNCDLIEYIEETPDSVITLTTGDKVVVEQRMAEIIDRIVAYRKTIAGLIESQGKRDLRRVAAGGQSD
jgi:flagellar protein FlbD